MKLIYIGDYTINNIKQGFRYSFHVGKRYFDICEVVNLEKLGFDLKFETEDNFSEKYKKKLLIKFLKDDYSYLDSKSYGH